MKVNKIEDAIEAFKNGSFIVVMDDEDRENEGDLIIPAQHVTPDNLAFMIRYTSGVLTVPMTSQRLQELELPLMVHKNTEPHRTAFTISVDYLHNTTTGISASDRAATIQALANPNSKPTDFGRPGHIFPLQYREGGVLKRAGHTEASIDLCKLAGCEPVGVICELVHDDGSMLRGKPLFDFAAKYKFPIITIADLIRYRQKKERLVSYKSKAKMPTKFGEFTAYAYQSVLDTHEHLALVMGNPQDKENILVRVHSECLTGDMLGSLRCDCGAQLEQALEKIAEEGEGILVYLRGHEGRGIGLCHKISAYNLQDEGYDTVEANIKLGMPVDSREYGIGAQILQDLGVTSMRLLTNNPGKYGGLSGYNLEVIERIALLTSPTVENQNYLITKAAKMGHEIPIELLN